MVEITSAQSSNSQLDSVLPGLTSVLMYSRASDIEGHRNLKQKRSMLHGVVHLFREAHGFANYPILSDAPYGVALAKYRDLPIANEIELRAIEKLSSPSEYAAIRQGERMRASTKQVADDHLKDLCVEISAALRWAETFRTDR